MALKDVLRPMDRALRNDGILTRFLSPPPVGEEDLLFLSPLEDEPVLIEDGFAAGLAGLLAGVDARLRAAVSAVAELLVLLAGLAGINLLLYLLTAC